MRDDPAVVALVTKARDGDRAAWNAIVDRYAPLVWAVCRRYRLSDADAADAVAGVWLRLVENLGALREPAALPGWLATTTQRECAQLLRGKARQVPVADIETRNPDTAPGADEWLLTAERQLALRNGFADLSEQCRRLLTALFSDPPLAYAKVSTLLGMPVGAIGPRRQRCLQRLRETAAVMALGEPGTAVRP